MLLFLVEVVQNYNKQSIQNKHKARQCKTMHYKNTKFNNTTLLQKMFVHATMKISKCQFFKIRRQEIPQMSGFVSQKHFV